MVGPQARRSWWRDDSFRKRKHQPTLFTLGRYVYRAWVTNMSLRPPASGTSMTAVPAWTADRRTARRFRVAQDSHRVVCGQCVVLGNHSAGVQSGHRVSAELFAGVVAKPDAHEAALQAFLLPGELTRPQNRPVLRLRESPMLQDLANNMLARNPQGEAPPALKAAIFTPDSGHRLSLLTLKWFFLEPNPAYQGINLFIGSDTLPRFGGIGGQLAC